MIKAVIFDCFGVLTSDGWLPFKQEKFGADPDKFEEAGRINFLADSGKISKDQFVSQIAELAGVTAQEVVRASEANVANKPIFGLIRELRKSDYKIGMLSNVSGDWLDRLFTKEEVGLFDSLALSYDTGVAKPNRRAYEIICERVACDPQEAVFIDDQERYIEGAKLAGLHTILYKNMEQLESDLASILKVSDSNK